MKELTRIVKSDIYNGVFLRIGRYVLPALFGFVVSILFQDDIKSRMDFLGMETNISALECILCIFKGMKKFDPVKDTVFDMPIIYVVFNMYLAYLIGDYLEKDGKGFGIHMLISSGSRYKWWISKCVWNLLTVLMYYISVIVGVVLGWLVYSRGKGGFFSLHSQNMSTLIQNKTVNVSVGMVVLFLVTALTVSIAVSIAQMFLSTLIKSIGSFMVAVVLYVASAYYCAAGLLGNYMMLLRIQDMHMQTGLIISVIIIIASYVIGGLYFKYKDLM